MSDDTTQHSRLHKSSGRSTNTDKSGGTGDYGVAKGGKLVEAAKETIENIGSNFIQHVQQTETENANFKEENKKLEQKILDLLTKERHLVSEKELLSGELEELRSHHVRVKDENAELLRRLSESKKRHESEVSEVKKENTQLQKNLGELEAAKTQIATRLEEANRNSKEFDEKLSKQSAVIEKLKEELSALTTTSADGSNDVSNKELNKLRQELEEKQRQIQELRSSTKDSKSNADQVTSLEKERSILNAEISKLKEVIKTKTREVEDLQRKVDSLMSSKKTLEKNMRELKQENSTLKSESSSSMKSDSDKISLLEERIQVLTGQLSVMKASESAMAELLKSKENHILDLRSEVTEMRNTSDLYRRDLEELRSRQGASGMSVLHDKYGDIVNVHRKTLEENKRLRTLLATKSMAETNSQTDNKALRAELEVSARRLSAATRRVTQLETWMDEIFKNADYDVVLKADNGRESIVSLPEIPEPRRTVTINQRPPLNNQRNNRRTPHFKKLNGSYMNREMPGNS